MSLVRFNSTINTERPLCCSGKLLASNLMAIYKIAVHENKFNIALNVGKTVGAMRGQHATRLRADPPENCHLTVKKLPKIFIFFK